MTLALAATAIAEDGGTTTVSAKLSHPSSAATVTVTAVSDFYTVGSDATVVIAAGQTANATDTVTVAAVDDAIDNIVNRAVTVTGTAFQRPGRGRRDGREPHADGRRGRARRRRWFCRLRRSRSRAGVATVTATLSGESSAAMTLTVGAAPGADTVAGDFTLSSPATLTVAAGETASTGTATVTAVDDTTDGPDKSVTVSATASGGGMADPASVTLTNHGRRRDQYRPRTR